MGLLSHMRRRLVYACCIFACLWFFGYGGYEQYEYYHPAKFHGTQLMTPGQLTSKPLSGGGGADDVPAKEEAMRGTKEEMAEEIVAEEAAVYDREGMEKGIKNLEDGIADSKADKMDAPEDVQEAPSSPAAASEGAPPAAPRLEWHFGRSGAGGAGADGSSNNDSYHCPPPPPMAGAGSATSGDVCAGQKWSHYPSLPVRKNRRAQPTRALAPLTKAPRATVFLRISGPRHCRGTLLLLLPLPPPLCRVGACAVGTPSTWRRRQRSSSM